jgi:hypothetical protein
VRSIIMLVVIGITGAFISTLAAGLTRSRTEGTSAEKDPKAISDIKDTIGKKRDHKRRIFGPVKVDISIMLAMW